LLQPMSPNLGIGHPDAAFCKGSGKERTAAVGSLKKCILRNKEWRVLLFYSSPGPSLPFQPPPQLSHKEVMVNVNAGLKRRTMVKPVVGKCRTQTYNLPEDPNFTYGMVNLVSFTCCGRGLLRGLWLCKGNEAGFVL